MAILDELVLPRGVIFGDVAQPKQDIYEESATAEYQVGTKLVYGDGRIYRYCRNGAGALTAAYMTQSEVIATDLTETVLGAGLAWAVGDVDGTITVGTGTGIVDNELVGGTLWVNKVGTLGLPYKIIASALQATDTLLDLKLASPIRTAIAVSDECSVVPHPNSNVVVFPTTTTGMPTGIPNIDVTAEYYFWAQTGGDCTCIWDTAATPAIGSAVGAEATLSVAGAAGVWVTVTPMWGYVRTTGVAAESGILHLMLDR
jgi:hypothetical protein